MASWQTIVKGLAKTVLAVFLVITGLVLLAYARQYLGIIPTLFLCVVIATIYSSWMVVRQVKRHRIGFRTVAEHNPDLADQSGSTARHGVPYDPTGIIPRHVWEGKRRRIPGDLNEDEYDA